MRTKNFSVATTLLQKPINIFGGIISVLMLPLDFAERLGSYVWRMVEMTLVASLLGTDYKSAAYIIYMYKGMEVFPDDSADEEEEVEESDEYEPVLVHPPVDPELIGEDPYTIDLEEEAVKPDKVTGRALDVLYDFAETLYESLDSERPLIRQDGFLGRRTRAPWTQRGQDSVGHPIPPSVKRRMEEIIYAADPPLFDYDEATTTWQLDLLSFPDFDAFRQHMLSIDVKKLTN